MVFISTIILARLLVQEDFGVAGYALVVISFLDIMHDMGIGSALVYHKDEEGGTDTAFYLNLVVGLLFFGIVWLIAPAVGLFFGDERAIPLLRVLGLTFPFTAIGNIHNFMLVKELNFQRRFLPDLIKAMGKGVISIVLALSGWGAWALVWGQVGGTLLGGISYWFVVRWRPALTFHWSIARSLLSYGLKIVSINGTNIIIRNIDYLLVGRYLGAEALGVYSLAYRIPDILIKQFAGTLAEVSFPAYTKLRDDQAALTHGFLTAVRYVAIFTVPMAIGMALVAEPLVIVLFTEKWLDAVPVISGIAIFVLIRTLIFSVADIYKAKGKLAIWLWLSLPQAVLLVGVLWWAVTGPGTVAAVAWAQVGVGLISNLLHLVAAAWILEIPARKILHALRPAAVCGFLMGMAVWNTVQVAAGISPLYQLILAVSVGVVVYGTALWWLQRELVIKLLGTILGPFSIFRPFHKTAVNPTQEVNDAYSHSN